MLPRHPSFFVACSAFCLISLTLSLCVGMPSTSVPPVDKSIDEPSSTQNTTDDLYCDARQTNSNGTSVCLVRTWPPDCLGYIALAGLIGFTAFFLTLPCILAAIGFGFIGITAGSLAALFQGKCGTPCCFRCAQSTAMLGTPLGTRGLFAVVGLIMGVVVGVYWVPMCFTEEGSSVYNISSGFDQVVNVITYRFNTSVN